MGLFTHVDLAAAQEIAERFALGQARGIEGIAAGTVNSNYRLTTDRAAYFLRVNEGKHEADVAWEAAFVAHLAADGVPTPPPLRERGGAGWSRTSVGLVTLFPWLHGAPRSSRTVGPVECAAVGAALARMHLAAAGREHRPHALHFLAIADRATVAAVGAGFGDGDPEWAEVRDELARERDYLVAAAPARARLPSGIIHGDLFPDNTLFDGERLVALLDFEQAGTGPWLYDLAVCLTSWCYADDFLPDRARALVAGYERCRALAAEERAGLATEARAAAARFCLTRYLDVEQNPAATDHARRTKDYRRYRDRSRRLRALGEPGVTRLAFG